MPGSNMRKRSSDESTVSDTSTASGVISAAYKKPKLNSLVVKDAPKPLSPSSALLLLSNAAMPDISDELKNEKIEKLNAQLAEVTAESQRVSVNNQMLMTSIGTLNEHIKIQRTDLNKLRDDYETSCQNNTTRENSLKAEILSKDRVSSEQQNTISTLKGKLEIAENELQRVTCAFFNRYNTIDTKSSHALLAKIKQAAQIQIKSVENIANEIDKVLPPEAFFEHRANQARRNESTNWELTATYHLPPATKSP